MKTIGSYAVVNNTLHTSYQTRPGIVDKFECLILELSSNRLVIIDIHDDQVDRAATVFVKVIK